MSNHNGKSIWIIGCSSGIGEALARELHGQGAKLILSARSEDKLNALNNDLGNKHQVMPVDASDFKSLSDTCNKIETLDSVVYLAAIYAPHSDKPHEIDFVHKMINVNLGGAFNTVYAVRDRFAKQGHGHIALCGSVAGFRGLPNGQPYCATKAAIINYCESLKIELEPQNIDVQVINPGFVKSPLTDKNEFDMPMIMETADAAKALADGLASNSFEIHFPKKFTYIMKLIHLLPSWLYFPLARQMRDKQ